jgi:hypothetical protein
LLGDGKLLSPERRRRAVTVLCERFRVSERRACQLVGQNRTTQRNRERVTDIGEYNGTYQESCPLGVLELSTFLKLTSI